MTKLYFWIPAFIFAIFTLLRDGRGQENMSNQSKTFDFTYKVNIQKFPANTKDLKVFIPIATTDKFQEIKKASISTSGKYTFQYDPVFGNKIAAVRLHKKEVPGNFSFTVKYKVVRNPITDPSDYRKTPGDSTLYLRPDNLIPLDSTMINESRKALKNRDKDNYTKARAFYYYLLQTMRYDKSGTGWGRGDALYACNSRKGNCTDFHSLFIGMSRVEKIPAKFHIGFPVPCDKKKGKIHGYHCWIKFYDREKGWVPADISEGWKNPGKRDFYFGSLDPCRITFSTGRDIPLRIDKDKTVQLNYFIYPYVLVNGKKWNDEVKTSFYFKSGS